MDKPPIVKPNWREIETRYITGTETLAQLASAFGLNPKAVEQQAMRNEWTKKRRELSDSVRQIAIDKLTQLRVDAMIEFATREIQFVRKAYALLDDGLDAMRDEEGKPLLDDRVMRRLTASKADAQKIGRLACGIATENHAHHVSGPNGGAIVVQNQFGPQDEELLKEAMAWALKNI